MMLLPFLVGCAAIHADRSAAPPLPDHRSAPPLPNERGQYAAQAETFRVVFTTTPRLIPFNEPFEMLAQLETQDGAPLDDGRLSVAAAMPENHSSMTTQPRVARQPDGAYHVRGMLLHMPGYWEIDFDLERDGRTERARYGFELE